MLAVDTLLALGVLFAWLAAAAALRFRTALDRLHAASFAGVVPLALFTIGAFADEGASSRTLNIVFLFFVLLIFGGGVIYASARAIDHASSERP